ncbi:TIC 55, chloroplastic [Seminavis robusta]|uniref:TIC 55, chloroplastic n=1 Tax=Seminavis robusta TaxID=568900 RepID=A0A9N8F2N3_9STRA|nr:TIC 55, chloroplastic [Seminavis robusta]|eukprot:Sro2539_g330590.1 TIC 55, chloroplastic (610) ;mRNA; f:7302-9131
MLVPAVLAWAVPLLVRSVDAFCLSVTRSSSTVILQQDIATEPSTTTIKEGPRPLDQNWWPVTLSSALDPTRPNPIELLDKKLVLYESSPGQWSCLEDQCAHRFAPLSEGRVVHDSNGDNKKCLQCAYHGWEYNGHGSCTRIPQLEETSSPKKQEQLLQACGVAKYPVQEAAGMIWVWADPTTTCSNDSLPISSLLQRFHQVGGTARGFMRDLPYGFEYLGENLVDASHLPFSHHSVGALNRNDGRPVPLHMLSHSERVELSHKLDNGQDQLPLFQARVENAAQHDPEIVAALKNPIVANQSDPALAMSHIGFFEPCNVRYHRNAGIPGNSYEIQLFMCPTGAGKSRVFLFTPFEAQLPPLVMEKSSKTTNTTTDNKDDNNTKKKVEPSPRMARTVGKLFGRTRKKAPAFPAYVGHMIAHSIFDGDGIFLNKQGDRMRRSALTYKDYHTPTSSDIMVNAFRRWLDRAATVTTSPQLALAATGQGAVYLDDRSRADMLDRYTSHTAHCSICRDALNELQNKKETTNLAISALVGAAGASGVLTVSAAIVGILTKWTASSSSSRMALVAMISCATATVGSIWGARKSLQEREKTEKEIRRFYFEDYVHAEKD